MSSRIKNYLGIAAIISTLLLGMAAFNAAGAYSSSIEPSSYRSFSVSGQGEAVGIPDVAEFTFSVISQGGTDIAPLQQDNTSKANAAIDFVKANGVEDEDIKTSNYNLSPRYQHFSCPSRFSSNDSTAEPCPPSEIVGYTITQTIAVKVRDFAKIGDIVSGVVENGANSVSQLSFKIDDPTAVQNEARAEAIEKAKDKAVSIAKAGGFRIGRLLSIEEGGGFTPPHFAREESFGAADTVAAGVKIEPGSEELSVNVRLVYEIQ